MVKFFGKVGYIETVETSPGVWEEQITECNYYGDMIRNNRRLQSTDKLNDDINISNEFSIVADPYAMNHYYSMKYIEFAGTKWKITNVDASTYPRLTLSVGGVYNG